MLLFRAVQVSDQAHIYTLAQHQEIGLTTLSSNIHLLKPQIKQALLSFQEPAPQNGYYLFVLEDLKTHQIVGTSAIASDAACHGRPYVFQQDITKKILYLNHFPSHYSELCTLYLHPSHRAYGNGLLLSLARFLFIHSFPKRFHQTILAELRGFADHAGHVPFWEAVGQKTFGLPFEVVDEYARTKSSDWIKAHLPTEPILIASLPLSARTSLGIPHPHAKPAMRILEREGFRRCDYVDILDGGPAFMAIQPNIRTIQKAQQSRCKIGTHTSDIKNRCLISNTSLNFKALLGKYYCDSSACILSSEEAEILQINNGDPVLFSTID